MKQRIFQTVLSVIVYLIGAVVLINGIHNGFSWMYIVVLVLVALCLAMDVYRVVRYVKERK